LWRTDRQTDLDNLWNLIYMAPGALSDSFEFIGAIEKNLSIYLSIYLRNLGLPGAKTHMRIVDSSRVTDFILKRICSRRLLAHTLHWSRSFRGLMFCCCFMFYFLVFSVRPIISTFIEILLSVLGKIIFEMISNQNQNHGSLSDLKSWPKSNHKKWSEIKITFKIILNHKIKIIIHTYQLLAYSDTQLIM